MMWYNEPGPIYRIMGTIRSCGFLCILRMMASQGQGPLQAGTRNRKKASVKTLEKKPQPRIFQIFL